MKKTLKSILVVVACVLQLLIVTSSSVYGVSTNILGTNKALGSPVLDSSFNTDDWNKWEMIAWGVFLSNFPVPFVDDYESAFSSGVSYGSKGSGYKALQFASGSDDANSEIIEAMCQKAILMQTGGPLKRIYVGYSTITDGILNDTRQTYLSSGQETNEQQAIAEGEGQPVNSEAPTAEGEEQPSVSEAPLGEGEDQNTGTGTEEAAGGDFSGSKYGTLADLLPEATENSDTVSAYIHPHMALGALTGTTFGNRRIKSDEPNWAYMDIAIVETGKIPTFYIISNGSYINILDYCNGWDGQIVASTLASGLAGELQEELSKILNDIGGALGDYPLYMDTFGNIVIKYQGSRRVVLPASANIHLTNTPKINLLSSVYLNGMSNGSVDPNNLVKSGRQEVQNMFGTRTDKYAIIRDSGVPAFGDQTFGMSTGSNILFFDSDAAIGAHWKKSGYTTAPSVPMAYQALFGYTEEIKKGLITESIPKIEAINFNQAQIKLLDEDIKLRIANLYDVAGSLANSVGYGLNAELLTKIKNINTGTYSELFSNPIAIAVQQDPGQGWTNISLRTSTPTRAFINYVFQVWYKGVNVSGYSISRSDIIAILQGSDGTSMGLKEALFTKRGVGGDNNAPSDLLKSFIISQPDLFEFESAEDVKVMSIADLKNPFTSVMENAGSDYAIKSVNYTDSEVTEIKDPYPGRIVVAYPINSVMQKVSDVLGVRDGTEFALYSPSIYLTYLDFYGLKKGTDGKSFISDFNPSIFDEASDVLNMDISTLADFETKEDKEGSIIDYAYLMLSPTKGRTYRAKLLNDSVSDFIYQNYQKIVYGSASEYYSGAYSSLQAKNTNGFLDVENYSENFMTAWLMDIYPSAAIVIIGAAMLIIVLMAIIKRKKIMWLIVSVLMVITGVLVTPAVGEIVPYAANSMVQGMFSDKMTYWAISESTFNSNMLNDYFDSMENTSGATYGGLTDEEKEQMLNLVKSLNVVYLDRSLTVRNDISHKMTNTNSNALSDIQSLRSAQWMIPIMIRQFTSSDSAADYVYVPLSDMYDDVSNLYVRYVGEEAHPSVYTNGTSFYQMYQSDATINDEFINVYDVAKTLYPDFQAWYSEIDISGESHEYRSEAYTGPTAAKELPHTYFYILNCPNMNGGSGAYNLMASRKNFLQEEDIFGAYLAYCFDSTAGSPIKTEEWESTAEIIENQASTYDRTDASTVATVDGYLLATESVYPYMYFAVKDSIKSTESLGTITALLQGGYTTNTSGEEVRKSFMHSRDTGYVKDIVDLEALFKNMVPYLYEMQILAGGEDGVSGLLGDSKVQNYQLYENNDRSWLYRSNWATKMMEHPELSKKQVCYDGNGAAYEVANPMLPDCYPENRPMIFSEAQMEYCGLAEDDLTTAELKCVNINKEIARRWTLLLNYVNVDGMTTEVLLRQMTTEAVIAFNKEFSATGLRSISYKLYPDGIDLRAISFDSVMKMIMLNITKDVTYIYSDTMATVIDSMDMFTAILLLISAFLCAYAVPLIRTVALGLVFFLGMLGIIYSLLGSNKNKRNVSLGYILTNLLVLIETLAYFGVFSIMISVVSNENVLNYNTVSLDSGNPVWAFIIIIAVSCIYAYGLYAVIRVCIKNYRDMGLSVYVATAHSIASFIGTKVGGAANNIKEAANEGEVEGNGGSDGDMQGSAGRGRRFNAGKTGNRDDLHVTVHSDRIDYDRDDSGNFDIDEDGANTGKHTANSRTGKDQTQCDIEAEIEKGRRELEEDSSIDDELGGF